MFGIWNGGDWLKEIFGSAQSMVKWFMEVPDLLAYAYINKNSFSFGSSCVNVLLNVWR